MNTKVFNNLINEEKVWNNIVDSDNINMLRYLKDIKTNYLHFCNNSSDLKPEYIFQIFLTDGINYFKHEKCFVQLQGLNDNKIIGYSFSPEGFWSISKETFINLQKTNEITFQKE